MNVRKYIFILFAISASLLTSSCENQESKKDNGAKDNTEKTAVLIVSHGSHSKTWRKTLIEMGETVKSEIIKNPKIHDVRSAFMEYNGPNIADQLKAFDKENYTKVIIVPMFLTISSHTSEDIQNIVGIKSNPDVLASLKEENIEVYNPKAKVIITPLLDFPGYLKKNIARRYKEISKHKGNEGVVLVAYGSTPYEQQWKELIVDIGKYLKNNAEVENISYAWCGHIVGYSSEPTTNAIKQILEMEQHAVVIPILVAVSENFQGKIISNAVKAIDNFEEKVTYRQDAILPDTNINRWVIDISNQTVKK